MKLFKSYAVESKDGREYYGVYKTKQVAVRLARSLESGGKVITLLGPYFGEGDHIVSKTYETNKP